MRETWYVLEDGDVADPNEVAPDEKGVLRHRGGVAVAMRDASFPLSRGVDDPAALRAKAPAQKPSSGATNAASAKDAKPAAPKGTYKTRESKAT